MQTITNLFDNFRLKLFYPFRRQSFPYYIYTTQNVNLKLKTIYYSCRFENNSYICNDIKMIS